MGAEGRDVPPPPPQLGTRRAGGCPRHRGEGALRTARQTAAGRGNPAPRQRPCGSQQPLPSQLPALREDPGAQRGGVRGAGHPVGLLTPGGPHPGPAASALGSPRRSVRAHRTPGPQPCSPSQMWGAAAQRHVPGPATLPPPPAAAAAAAGLAGEPPPAGIPPSPPARQPAPPPDVARSRLSVPVPQPQAPSAQVMDFLFEKWKLYGDQCLHNLSLLPPPSGERPRQPSARVYFLSSRHGKALSSPRRPPLSFTGEETESREGHTTRK